MKTDPTAAKLASLTPVVLTVAGSDSGGGAGIQADLLAFRYFGAYGVTALAAVTAQSPAEVNGIYPLAPAAVRDQLETVFAAFTVPAAKTGMLFNAAIIREVTAVLKSLPPLKLVVDPVMVAGSGARLLENNAVECLRESLLPLADVITPNLPEAEELSGRALERIDDATEAAVALARQFNCTVMLKGGHRAADTSVDIVSDGSRTCRLSSPLIAPRATHGTGCSLSAALAALLARGEDVWEACSLAKAYVYGCLGNCVRVGPDTWAMAPPASLPRDEIVRTDL